MEDKPGYKECPFCAEWIRERAIYCRFCRQMLPVAADGTTPAGVAAAPADAQSFALANLTRLAPKGLRELLLEDFEAASEAERRVITIMFADLCGYTALAEDRDPEYIRDLINRCFEKMAGAVEQYGGVVVHFLGDAVLAAFGAPRAHEDDPERAVRAALQMIEGIEKVGKAEKLDLGLAIGVHSGEVVVGGISIGDRLDFTAFGDAVNTASRLQSLAGFNEALISQRIYSQVHHAFECESRPPAFVKNKREPIVNYKVLGPKGRQLRQRPRGHGVQTLLVGRDKEMAQIQTVMRTLSRGKSAFLCLVGEPGVGKSRLTRELQTRLRIENLLWLEAGCVSFGSTLPYGPVLEILRTALGIQEGDTSERVVERIQQGTRGIEGARQRMRDALAYLLGETLSQNPLSQLDAKKRKEALIAESVAFIKGLALKQPMVLLIDDLHWSDPLTVEWMDALVADLGTRPMLVIGCYRPVFSHKWPETVKPAFVEVKELSDHDSRRLLFELLGVSSLPAGMVQDILNRTRGNPFFIEEMIHVFMDSGILVQRGQKWEFTREIKASEIPDTLRHVILARIDSLEVRLRRILQCASVIGRGFRYEILEYITDFQARLDSYVHELVDVHFLIEQSLLAELLYLFRHAVARDVTYETLLRRRRFEFHRKVGECIESLNANQLERHYEFLAHHFYHSDNPQKAAFYLERASDKLERLYANEAAIESLNRLLETLDKLPKSSEYGRLRAEALIRLGRIQKLIGEYEPSVAAYRNAIRVAERLSDGEDLAAKARRNLADVERLLGRHDKALRHLDLAGKTWERLGDAKSGLTVHNSRGVVFMAQGKYAQAAKAFREGVELARRAGTLPSLANALNDLGIACLHAARYDEALQTFTEALGRMEELADKKGMVACLNNLGMCHERLGQFGEALKFYGRSFELAEKIGHRYALLGSLINIGQCYQYQGDFRSAIRQFRRVVKLTDAQPNAYAASVARGNLATNLLFMDKDGDDVRKQLDEAYRLARASRNHLALINAALAEVLYLTRQQQYGKAERLARTTIEDIEKRGYADYQALAYRYLADALLGRKQAAEARRAVERSLRLADKAQSPRDRAWALWMRARVEQTAGRESAARSSAREARRLAERIGDKALLELAQSQ